MLSYHAYTNVTYVYLLFTNIVAYASMELILIVVPFLFSLVPYNISIVVYASMELIFIVIPFLFPLVPYNISVALSYL